MKRIFTIIAVFVGLNSFGQDLHYSMFTMAPLTLNPGLCGNFLGDLRVVNNYRMQWTPIDKPYNTYTISIDAPIPKHSKKRTSPDFWAVGLNANVDKAGSSNLRDNGFHGVFSYNKSFDGTGKSFVTLGFSAGYVLRSITLTGQSWDAQFVNLAYDPSLPTGETLTPNDNYGYGDFSTGVVYSNAASERFKMCMGLGLAHLSKPEIDFLGGKDRMWMKFTGHFNAEVALGSNSNAWLVPMAEFVRQGPAMMVNAGAGVKYQLSERSHYTNFQSSKYLSIGGMYRLGDAFSGYVRLDIGPVGAAFNYDVNVSPLTTATKGNGAMEFMLIYSGIYHDVNSRTASQSFF